MSIMLKSQLTLLKSFEDDQYCQFCNRNVVDTLLYGPIYKYEKIIAHYFCLLLSSNIRQNGTDAEGILGFLPEDIEKERARGRKLLCSYCRKKGASIGCAVKSCKTQFHLPCGVAREALSLFYDYFPSYCFKHRSCISFPELGDEHIENKTCLICLENITLPPSSVTWSTCCKNAWYHKRCMQEVAFNSGYYFRCPNCNNDKLFRKQMIDFGIYIPNQDASWEQEPNAYSSFYERYDHCDAATCYCPWGRNTCHREGSWQIILCYRCLQKGIHKRCGKGLIKRDLWSCSSQACLDENSNNPVVVTPEASSRIATRSSTLSSRCENKENWSLNSNANNTANTSIVQRTTLGVLNSTLVTARRRTSFCKRLRSHRGRLIGCETRASSSFAFNLPPVNLTSRQSLLKVVKRKRAVNSVNRQSLVKTAKRRRRSLRFRPLKVKIEEKKIRKKEVRRTKKYNPPKKKYHKSNSRNRNDFPCGQIRRRRYMVGRMQIRVYPADMRSIKNFTISL